MQQVYKAERPHGKIYKHVIYCVPSFSNPSGKTMPRARREELVRVARRFDALVVADDVYDFLSWGTALGSQNSTLPRLVDIDRVLDGGPHDRFGNVLSNGSFSKLIGPGCRVGWAEGTPSFIHGLSEAYVFAYLHESLQRCLVLIACSQWFNTIRRCSFATDVDICE